MKPHPLQAEILRVMTEMEKNGWITINEHLNKEVIAASFLHIFKDMTLANAISIFVPKELF